MIQKHTWVISGVIITLFFEVLLSFPHYLPYISPVLGGVNNGPFLVSDSNVDWGQDLKAIRDYMQTHDLGQPYIDYSWAGAVSLDYWGLSRRPLERLASDKTGYLILSTAAIQNKAFNWLKDHPTFDRITPSVWVYKLDE